MSFITIFLIAVGLAMDAFAVSVTNGIKQKSSRFGQALVSSLFFGIFQGIMPFLGWLMGVRFYSKIQSVDHWIAFGLLAFIGGHMIYEALHDKGEDLSENRFNFKELLLMSVATSIDALAVGVSFAMTGVSELQDILINTGIIAAVTAVICIAGFYIGRFFGTLCKKGAEIAGGSVLILIGIKILIEHLAA